MDKTTKLIIIFSLLVGVLLIGFCFTIDSIWDWNKGSDDNLTQIATYSSPDGKYVIVFEQIGNTAWSFGPAKVRLTLKNSVGDLITDVSTTVSNDGANATESNIASVTWGDDAVKVVLRAVEMPDKEITLEYKSK